MVHFFPEPSASFFECYIRKKAEKLEYSSKYPKKNMNLYRFWDKRYNKYIKHSEKTKRNAQLRCRPHRNGGVEKNHYIETAGQDGNQMAEGEKRGWARTDRTVPEDPGR